MRAGRFIRQIEEYQAFIPAPLPPDPPPALDAETINLLGGYRSRQRTHAGVGITDALPLGLLGGDPVGTLRR